MPSNRAIGFGENIEYGVYEIESVGEDSRAQVSDKIAIAKILVDDVKEKAKIESLKELGPVLKVAMLQEQLPSTRLTAKVMILTCHYWLVIL